MNAANMHTLGRPRLLRLRHYLGALLLFWSLLGNATHAQAQTCTASMSSVSFPTLSPIRRLASTATGTVSVSCTWPAVTLTPSVLVCLNLGGTPRALSNNANTLAYNLYTDAAHSLPWGSISAGSTPISVTLQKPAGVTASTTVTVYGQVAANQPLVPTVNSSDTIYSQAFTSAATSVNYAFYLLIAPTCASLTTSNGSFPFTASATVTNDCIITANNLTFPTANRLDAAITATSSLSVQCTNNDAYRIALSTGSSGSYAARRMSSGNGTVQYQLYLDAGRTTIWGDGTAGTTMYSATGTGAATAVTVYGSVPTQTTPVPGTFSDSITATISF